MFLTEEFLEFESEMSSLTENSVIEWFEYYFSGDSNSANNRLRDDINEGINSAKQANNIIDQADKIINYHTKFGKQRLSEILVDLFLVFKVLPPHFAGVYMLVSGVTKLMNDKNQKKALQFAKTAKKEAQEIKKKNGWK